MPSLHHFIIPALLSITITITITIKITINFLTFNLLPFPFFLLLPLCVLCVLCGLFNQLEDFDFELAGWEEGVAGAGEDGEAVDMGERLLPA